MKAAPKKAGSSRATTVPSADPLDDLQPERFNKSLHFHETEEGRERIRKAARLSRKKLATFIREVVSAETNRVLEAFRHAQNGHDRLTP